MKRNRSISFCAPARTGLLAALLTMTLSSTAQESGAGSVAPSLRRFEGPTQPLPYRTSFQGANASSSPARGFDVSAFETLAEQLTVGQRVPGLAMAIVQNGRVLSARGYGVTDVNAPQAVDSHTVFRLASLSKAFAGTLTGLLVNDGSLRWDSKVVDYVPGFTLSDSFSTQHLRVADLLSHRVGLRANTCDRDIEANATYYEVSQKLASAPMSCTPGECYAYQNVAFSLIGDVVYAASGHFYEQEVQRRIFQPLAMNDASLGLDGIERSPEWARPHIRSRNGWVPVTPKPTYYRLPPAAGVNASISDMAQWLVAQTGHRPDVLPVPLLATLHAPIIATPGEMRAGWRRERIGSASYALGWRVFDYAGHQVIFHAGAVQGYRGIVAVLPERDLAVAVLWNSESGLPSGLVPTIMDRALGLPPQQWLDVDASFGSDPIFAEGSKRVEDAGASAERANASPR
ncbi:MAG: beta-lactamase family protein [Xanthomonadaceae bacterium]|nr:beta-lactamase family protein [Xanthomonadaceae bacterium]